MIACMFQKYPENFFLFKFLFLFSSKKLQNKCYNQKTYKNFLYNKHKIEHLKVKIKAKKKGDNNTYTNKCEFLRRI